jgi:two-component system sensor histidine kinase MtrB
VQRAAQSTQQTLNAAQIDGDGAARVALNNATDSIARQAGPT